MIEVTRLLRYTYADADAMIGDMARWQLPATGSRYMSAHQGIESAVMLPRNISETEHQAMLDRIIDKITPAFLRRGWPNTGDDPEVQQEVRDIVRLLVAEAVRDTPSDHKPGIVTLDEALRQRRAIADTEPF